MDSYVSCRGIATVIDVCESRGIDLSGLTEGLDVDMDRLCRWHGMVPWTVGSVLVERLAEALGGNDAYCEVIASFVDDPAAARLQRFLRIGLTPKKNYVLVFRWVSALCFPFVVSTIETLDDSTLRIEQRIPDHLRGSLPFLQSAVALARVLPRVHGLPDAEVSAEVTEHLCRMVVTLPPSPSRFRRFGAWIATARDVGNVMEDLVEQQRLVLDTNAALEHALSDGKRRAAELAAEVEAKKRVQAELAKRSAQLIQAGRLDSLGRLAGGVAHDVNNVLTAIYGHAELLRLLHPDSAETQAGLDEIIHAGERAAALTRRLLTFAKQGRTQQKTVDLNVRLREMEGLLSGMLADVKVSLELPSVPLPVYVDPLQLEQVFINLTVNARDAMPDGGTVTIRLDEATRDGIRFVRIEVVDTGIGMTPEVQARIFEPFYTTKGEMGTGLGLATVYGIIMEAEGEIEVESTFGEGTCFRVWWPRDNTGASVDTSAEPAQDLGGVMDIQTAHVLVVEDQEQLRGLIERILTSHGFTVSLSADGAGALNIAESTTIDAVVADVMLKNERGPKVVGRIRERQANVPALFISGYADPETLATLQGSTFLGKPFTAEALISAVQQVIANAAAAPRD